MKLSDIKGERTLDVIAELIDPISNIASDKVAADLFVRRQLPKGKTPYTFVVERLKKAVPALLKGHKQDIIAIGATLEGVTPEQYAAELDLPKLFRDLLDLVTDKTFIELFMPAQTGIASGPAQEATTEPAASEPLPATPSQPGGESSGKKHTKAI